MKKKADNRIWIKIKGFSDYEISDYGQIRSNKYSSIRILKDKGRKDGRGYRNIILTKQGKQYTFMIHKLVALHFLKRTKGKSVINHIDGNRLNNHYSNLEWCTQKENIKHAWDTGLNNWVKAIYMKDMQGKVIRKFSSLSSAIKWLSENGFAKARSSNLRNASIGRYKYSYGYKWQYA